MLLPNPPYMKMHKHFPAVRPGWATVFIKILKL